MQKKEHSHKQKYDFSKEKITNKYRICDRREKDCPGITYIPLVGWICRREKTRRKDDNFFVLESC